MPEEKHISMWKKVFGESIIRLLFGRFFENKNNTASILAIILVITLCWVIIFRDKYEYISTLSNIIFVIVGYYFGVKQSAVMKESDTE